MFVYVLHDVEFQNVVVFVTTPKENQILEDAMPMAYWIDSNFKIQRKVKNINREGSEGKEGRERREGSEGREGREGMKLLNFGTCSATF